MGLAFQGEVTNWPCCSDNQGTNPVGTGVQYVISINGLQGITTLAAGGGISISSTGNSILIAADGSAGLGTVTTVNATSSNSNLVVTGGPVTTVGTFAFSLAGNLNSISGLTMAADQMLYSTGPGVFVATSLTAFGRSLIDDANATAAQTTLALVPGTNVQAFSQDLADFVTNASWSGADLTLSGALTTVSNLTVGGTGSIAGAVTITGLLSGAAGASFSGNVDAGTFSGVGTSLTALNASNVASGTLAVARGGTNISSYAVGDLLQATGATTLGKLASVAAGSFLRSGGVTTASAWSTLVLPNAATVGDLFSSSTTNTMSRITAVATGNALISGGVATLPSWGKITTAHTTGIAASGTNSDITQLAALQFITNDFGINATVTISGALNDSADSSGTSGYILSSTGSGVLWTNQVTLDTLTLDTNLGIEGTITAGGVTGAQTINKPSGTVNFAAAASSLVVTNSLATTSHRVQCTVCTNDTTAKAAAAVVTNGSFTIYLNAAATAETAVYWTLIQVT